MSALAVQVGAVITAAVALGFDTHSWYGITTFAALTADKTCKQ